MYLLPLLTSFLLVVGVPDAASAQDRGAPRFGPSITGDTLTADASDAGRLWSLATPPFDRLRRQYDVEADSAWATHLRRGLLRLPSCTAALVSEEGLALTADQCIRKRLDDGAQDEAFVAEKAASERSISGMYVDQLVRARDVTPEAREIREARGVRTPEAVEILQTQLQSEVKPGLRVEVSAAAAGATYEAYTFRRHDDVRLVFRPDGAVSDFGGLDTHLSYPRYTLDVAVLRVYTDNGRPLRPDHYFDTPTQDVRPGDVVFSVGQSTETRRSESAAQMATRRDVTLPAKIDRLEVWTDAVQRHVSGTDSPERHWQNTLESGKRTLKRKRAEGEALQSDYLMTRLERRDDRLRTSAQETPSLESQVGSVLDSLEAIQRAKRELAAAYRAFGGLSRDSYSSATLRRALLAKRASAASETGRDSLWARVRSVESQPTTVDPKLLAARLRTMTSFFGADSDRARRLLNGFSPDDRATGIVTGSVFSDRDQIVRFEAEGSMSVPPDDPAFRLVEMFIHEYESFLEDWRALRTAEAQLTKRLAQARFQLREGSVLPGGGGDLRLTAGRVLGYPYNGTQASSFTTLFGLYGQSRSFGSSGAWALPARWAEASNEINGSTPLNRVATTDPSAATDGAPLLNRHLQIVGVAGGTNIQGAGSSFIFLPQRMRTVAVDVGGLREVLRTVYQADGLANELFGSPMDGGEASP